MEPIPPNTQEEKNGKEHEISTKLSLSSSFYTETNTHDGKKKEKEYEVSTELSLASSFYAQSSKSGGYNKASSSNNIDPPMHVEMKVSPWEKSTTLALYEDPWKIKKVLLKSDVGESSRLLLATNLVEDLVLPMLGADARNVVTDSGIPVEFWDMDTISLHKLKLKRWSSSKSYVFIGSWHTEFVKRRNLEEGDEIGLHWDSFNKRFDFSVLKRALPKYV